jgi:hypothetical protein
VGWGGVPALVRTSPSPSPNRDVSRFGHPKLPKSGTPDLGAGEGGLRHQPMAGRGGQAIEHNAALTNVRPLYLVLFRLEAEHPDSIEVDAEIRIAPAVSAPVPMPPPFVTSAIVASAPPMIAMTAPAPASLAGLGRSGKPDASRDADERRRGAGQQHAPGGVVLLLRLVPHGTQPEANSASPHLRSSCLAPAKRSV